MGGPPQHTALSFAPSRPVMMHPMGIGMGMYHGMGMYPGMGMGGMGGYPPMGGFFAGVGWQGEGQQKQSPRADAQQQQGGAAKRGAKHPTGVPQAQVGQQGMGISGQGVSGQGHNGFQPFQLYVPQGYGQQQQQHALSMDMGDQQQPRYMGQAAGDPEEQHYHQVRFGLFLCSLPVSSFAPPSASLVI